VKTVKYARSMSTDNEPGQGSRHLGQAGTLACTPTNSHKSPCLRKSTAKKSLVVLSAVLSESSEPPNRYTS
jgi:hypothetical protein